MKHIYKNALAGLFVLTFSHTGTAQETATIPFEIGPRSHILIPVSINGSEQKTFVLDTGASITVINSERQDAFSIDETAAINAQAEGVSSMYDIRLVKLDEISLSPELTLKNVGEVALMDTSQFEGEPESDTFMPMWGILGFNFFKNYDLTINYKDQTLGFADHLDQDQCSALPGQEFELMMGASIAFDMVVNGAIVKAFLDTGSPRSMMNLSAATALNGQPIPEEYDHQAAPKTTGHQQTGHSGEEEKFGTATIDKMETGQETFSENSLIEIVNVPVFATFGLANKPAMIIGNDLLVDKEIRISYSCQKISFA